MNRNIPNDVIPELRLLSVLNFTFSVSKLHSSGFSGFLLSSIAILLDELDHYKLPKV